MFDLDCILRCATAIHLLLILHSDYSFSKCFSIDLTRATTNKDWSYNRIPPAAMSAPPPPTPKHLIRSHRAHVNVVHVSEDNERIYSGDAEGTVVITSTRSLRAIAHWKAHTDGLLGVQEWEGSIITSVRDSSIFSCVRL